MDPWDKSFYLIFPTKHVIPQSLKFSHWLSEVYDTCINISLHCIVVYTSDVFPRFFSTCTHFVSCWMNQPWYRKVSKFGSFVKNHGIKKCQEEDLLATHGCQPKNSGTPKSWILIGFSIIFTIHFGGLTHYFWFNTHIYLTVFFFKSEMSWNTNLRISIWKRSLVAWWSSSS